LHSKDCSQHILINKALKHIEVQELQSKVIPVEKYNIETNVLVDIPILDKKDENSIT